MKRSIFISIVAVILTHLVFSNSAKAQIPSDDFEDGEINYVWWDIGGGARGTYATDPIGTGPWSYSYDELSTLEAGGDGYLSVNVWGPGTANTFGAEAWIQTNYNFNDGQSHLINFTWDAIVGESHYNNYVIQVTDGYIPYRGDLHWVMRRPPLPPITEADLAGTHDILMSQYPDGTPRIGDFYPSGLPKSEWSMIINSTGIARLYDGPNGTGSLMGASILDREDSWYPRFMVSDGTSSGFGAGTAQLNLYDFASTEVQAETFGLFIGVDSDDEGPFWYYHGARQAETLYETISRNLPNFNEDDSHLLALKMSDGGVTRDAIESAISDISAKMGPEDTLILYVAGHGRNEGVTGSGNEEVTDTKSDECVALGWTWEDDHKWAWDLTDDEFTEMLLPFGNASKWVLMDSCYSGGFWGDPDNPADIDEGDLGKLPNLGLLAASSELEQAWAPGGDSAFFHVLQEAFTPWFGNLQSDMNLDGILTFSELSNFVLHYDLSAFVGMPSYPIDEGDPVPFTLDMWNPVAYTTTDFVGSIDASAEPIEPIPAPGAIVLVAIGAGLVGYLRRCRTL